MRKSTITKQQGRSYNKQGNKAKARKQRVKRAKLRANGPKRIRERPGAQPASIFHPQHPARLYGWDDERTTSRDRSKWA